MTSDTVTGPARVSVGAWPMRLHVPTERSDLRVTWHRADDVFTVSMWHGQECVGSAPLSPPDAANLSAFLVQHLGDRAAAPENSEASSSRRAPRWLSGLRRRIGR